MIGLFTPVNPALAALGEPETSVAHDREVSRGTDTVRVLPGGVRMHRIVTPTGTYREFSGSDGIVFAVTWQGMHPPPLSTVLGSYEEEYRQAIRTVRQGSPSSQGRSRVINIRSPHLRITGMGHPRDLRGMVKILGKGPPGFNPQDIPPASP